MDLIYWRSPEGNFGDDLNAWFWDEVLPGWRAWPGERAIVGIGSILNGAFLPAGRPKLVLGSGFAYGTMPDLSDRNEWEFRCVRGPRTAQALGLDPSLAVVDPAALLPRLLRFSDIARHGKVVFVPHEASFTKWDWGKLCAGLDIDVVDPRRDADWVIHRIAGAERVIAESMHAAIIADAFRVPWHGLALTASFNHFKWGDWGASLDLEPRITRCFGLMRWLQARLKRSGAQPAANATAKAHGQTGAKAAPTGGLINRVLATELRWRLADIARTPAGFQLSDSEILAARQDRLLEIFAEVSRDYGTPGA